MDERLHAVLSNAQRQGFLGASDVWSHVQHARAHDAAAQPESGQRWCDLGSGGGIPGLVMALDRPGVAFVLLDRSRRRTDFLKAAAQELELSDRVDVALGDAAELARLPQHRHAYDGIVSRAFGPPSAVAECSAGLLRLGGRLVVSEPPEHDGSRWPAAQIEQLGLRVLATSAGEPAFAVLQSFAAAPADVPRSWKQLRKRPLF
ncbi:16S rRNA (guanine(527)-N(7))-methyltransferase RsmG [Candidatus Poriferisodalis sp.]|uniref:16S rRNA (guanine(527)-N(7))-methyltransferase RsmG n=1 Tax=Candidatus Poriferisodalis sp. TaxID=3101277 RepID=UPI003B019E5F